MTGAQTLNVVDRDGAVVGVVFGDVDYLHRQVRNVRRRVRVSRMRASVARLPRLPRPREARATRRR